MADLRLKAKFCTGAGNPHFVDSLHKFRARLFVYELGWSLPVAEGRERDQFDGPETVHCGLLNDDAVVGYFRAVRTDRPYLGRTVFGDVAEFRPFPARVDMWEISRFGVQSATAHFTISRTLYGLVFLFGFAIEATSLVALTDLNHERFVRLMDIKTRRFGHPKTIGYDTFGRPIEVVAGDIPMAEQGGSKFQQILNLAAATEIEDALHVFGRARLSA